MNSHCNYELAWKLTSAKRQHPAAISKFLRKSVIPGFLMLLPLRDNSGQQPCLSSRTPAPLWLKVMNALDYLCDPDYSLASRLGIPRGGRPDPSLAGDRAR